MWRNETFMGRVFRTAALRAGLAERDEGGRYTGVTFTTSVTTFASLMIAAGANHFRSPMRSGTPIATANPTRPWYGVGMGASTPGARGKQQQVWAAISEVCPDFPGQPNMIHWSIPDPAREGGSDEETYPAFERTADELATRIPFLLDLIEHDLSLQEVTTP